MNFADTPDTEADISDTVFLDKKERTTSKIRTRKLNPMRRTTAGQTILFIRSTINVGDQLHAKSTIGAPVFLTSIKKHYGRSYSVSACNHTYHHKLL